MWCRTVEPMFTPRLIDRSSWALLRCLPALFLLHLLHVSTPISAEQGRRNWAKTTHWLCGPRRLGVRVKTPEQVEDCMSHVSTHKEHQERDTDCNLHPGQARRGQEGACRIVSYGSAHMVHPPPCSLACPAGWPWESVLLGWTRRWGAEVRRTVTTLCLVSNVPREHDSRVCLLMSSLAFLWRFCDRAVSSSSDIVSAVSECLCVTNEQNETEQVWSIPGPIGVGGASPGGQWVT